MDDIEKKFWKKVYMYYGDDYFAFLWDNNNNPFDEEYRKRETDGTYVIKYEKIYPKYFDTKTSRFTKDFLNGVLTW